MKCILFDNLYIFVLFTMRAIYSILQFNRILCTTYTRHSESTSIVSSLCDSTRAAKVLFTRNFTNTHKQKDISLYLCTVLWTTSEFRRSEIASFDVVRPSSRLSPEQRYIVYIHVCINITEIKLAFKFPNFLTETNSHRVYPYLRKPHGSRA